jgi:phenylalanyl-tRNA synthetase alpha chain
MTTEAQDDGERALAALVAEAERAIGEAGSLADLDAVEAATLGRRSALAARQRALASVPVELRPAAGRRLQEARAALEAAIAGRRRVLEEAERAARVEAERLDLTEVVGASRLGHRHLVTQTLESLEDIFVGMGFVVAEGPEAESEWHNFTALNMPANHPARAAQDSFYLDLPPEGRYLLRTHTSPVQIRLMLATPPPIWAVVPGRCYRRDTPDARHLPTFHQVEALVVDRGISFRHLAATIATFTEALLGAGMRSRLRPGYFPFTEPSAELDVTCVVCRGAGCRTCSQSGWIEAGGAGLVHPAVFRHVGLDPEEWSGFAFGFGVERLTMLRVGLEDIRLLTDVDRRVLAQS